MDTLIIAPIIALLQSLSPEMVSVILLGACLASLLILFKIFGCNGLYIYNVVAIITANIQVLKGTQFSLSSEPVALGTVVFATTYLCSDILTEHFGKGAATRGIGFCFAAQLLITLLMVITLGYPPIPTETAEHLGLAHFLDADKALACLFMPSPRLLFASLLAFIVSHFLDIQLFSYVGKLTGQGRLWLRTLLATSTGALVDTVLFSFLAWVLLTHQPVNFKTLFFTYILGTLVTRLLIAILSTPTLYLSYACLPLKRSYAP